MAALSVLRKMKTGCWRQFQTGRRNFWEMEGIILFFVSLAAMFSVLLVHSKDQCIYRTNEIISSGYMILESGQKLEQELKYIEEEKLLSVNILFGTFQRKNNGTIQLDLLADGESVESWSVPSSQLEDGQYYAFKLESPFLLDPHKVYRIRLAEKYKKDNCVAIYTNSETDGGYTINGEKEENGSVCYTLAYQYKRYEKFRKVFLVTWLLISLIIAAMVIVGLNETLIMSVSLIVLLFCYMWVCPAPFAPDEENHFRRAYEIANVSLISEHIGENGIGGNTLPVAIIDVRNTEAEIDWNETAEIPFGTTALYAPVSYLPHVVGIRISQLFTNKVTMIYYGGRWGNAVASLILCVLALWLIPFGRKILFCIIMFPMTMQEMVAMSPDGFTIAMSLFFIAYILKVAYGPGKVRKRDILILGITGICISLLKIVYVVLLILVLMIPREKFQSLKASLIFKCGLVVAACFSNFIWLKVSFGYLIEFNPGVNSPVQVKYVLTHIGEYYSIVIRSFLNESHYWISTMISSRMGAYNIAPVEIIWIGFLVLLVYEICRCYPCRINVRKYDYVIMAVTFLAGVALILTSLYVQWTPLKNNTINGVQGRYFIPVVGCLAFAAVLERQYKITKSGINQDLLEGKGRYYYLLILLLHGIIILDLFSAIATK